MSSKVETSRENDPNAKPGMESHASPSPALAREIMVMSCRLIISGESLS